jgi:hypothetical protein
MRKIFSSLGFGALGALIGAIGGCLILTILAGISAAQDYQTGPVKGTGWAPFDIFWKIMFALAVGLIGAVGGAAILGIPALIFSAVWNIFKKDKKLQEPHDQNS